MKTGLEKFKEWCIKEGFYKGLPSDMIEHFIAEEQSQKPEADCLSKLGKEIIEINTANGWNVLKQEQWGDTYKIPGILALIHSEVSEALEAFRNSDLENFREELADVIIRVLDCSEGLGLNMDEAIREKLLRNRSRGFRHGNKKV